ncbi:MAG: S1C family serine protease [Alphaproteobacteria bacterium]
MPLPIGAEVEPIEFAKISVNVRRGTRIGGYYSQLGCDPTNEILTWEYGRTTVRDIEFADIFYDELTNANFDVVGDPKRLFERQEEFDRATYAVGGQMTDIQMNLCRAVKLFTNVIIGFKGEAVVKVTWQLYSKLSRKVVLEVVTEGAAKTTSPSWDGDIVLIQEAFAAAAANLAVHPDFRGALIRKPELAQPQDVRFETREVPRIPPIPEPITANMDNVRLAAVTIEMGEGTHGSGFFVSESGLLLTNAHVVGEAKFVRVVLTTGRAILGEVLRVHKLRDVALVQVEEKGMRALPIRTEPAVIGEEVYAVGTPLERELRTTVTKGIVSAYRTEKLSNLRMIQADVDIHGGNSGGPLVDAAGNVVGITVAGFGLGPGKTSVGLNLFIPIQDALEKLNLRLGEPDQAS